MSLKGEVWEVNLDPVHGYEQSKTSPCVIICNDIMNTKMQLSIVVSFTGTGRYSRSGKLSPAMVEVLPPEDGLKIPSYSMSFQIRFVAYSRFTNKLGALSADKLQNIVRSVQEIVEL